MTPSQPRIADLFCGAGGAAMGLHRAGFEVVGFDHLPQPRYPFEFHQQDAFEVDLSGFDAVWASPPCQYWVDPNSGHDRGYTDLIAPLRPILQAVDKPYIIENVDRAPLYNWILLCGTMFRLPLIRHRHFECVPLLPALTPTCNHWGKVSTGEFAAVYGRGGKGPRRGTVNGVRLRDARPLKEGPDPFFAMEIDWMTKYELTQAIPPAYSEFLGKQLMQHLKASQPRPEEAR